VFCVPSTPGRGSLGGRPSRLPRVTSHAIPISVTSFHAALCRHPVLTDPPPAGCRRPTRAAPRWPFSKLQSPCCSSAAPSAVDPVYRRPHRHFSYSYSDKNKSNYNISRNSSTSSSCCNSSATCTPPNGLLTRVPRRGRCSGASLGGPSRRSHPCLLTTNTYNRNCTTSSKMSGTSGRKRGLGRRRLRVRQRSRQRRRQNAGRRRLERHASAPRPQPHPSTRRQPPLRLSGSQDPPGQALPALSAAAAPTQMELAPAPSGPSPSMQMRPPPPWRLLAQKRAAATIAAWPARCATCRRSGTCPRGGSIVMATCWLSLA
jgi:hypothetical protein